MPWVISFIVAWAVFLFAGRAGLGGGAVWGGLGAVSFQIVTDRLMISQDLYQVQRPVLVILQSSAFFTFGPALAMGILFTQHLPRARWLQAVNIVVWAGFFLVMETLLRGTGALVYRHWSTGLSCLVDLLVLSTLTWLLQGRPFRRNSP